MSPSPEKQTMQSGLIGVALVSKSFTYQCKLLASSQLPDTLTSKLQPAALTKRRSTRTPLPFHVSVQWGLSLPGENQRSACV